MAREDGLEQVAPFAAAGDAATPITIRTAILMTLAQRGSGARLRAGCASSSDSVDATGEGAAFDYFVLSDTNDPAVAAAEERLAAEWQRELGEAAPAHLSPPHRQCRLQGRQCPRFLRALGRRLRA